MVTPAIQREKERVWVKKKKNNNIITHNIIIWVSVREHAEVHKLSMFY